MKNTCRLYIVCQILKLLLIKLFNMQPPSSFISHLLFYIFLFNGFTQGDHVVSCPKKNLHYHYPLHLQNWTALNYLLKEVWGYPSFILEQPNPVSHKRKSNYLHPWGWAFQAPLFRMFPWLWLLMLLGFFNPLSGHQYKASVTLLLIALPQEKSHNSVLIYTLRDMIWCYMYTR